MKKDDRRTVLVTGCSKGGIGDALAREFHRRGLRVFATARNLAKIQHLADMGLETLALDVEDSESIKKAAAEVDSLTGGRLDILVNNSGCGYNATILDSDLEEVKKIFNVNVFGLLENTQAFAPLVIAGRGQIVNIGSAAVQAAVPFQGMYNASKSAIHAMSEVMRHEMAPFGVQVIYVITGGIKTHFFDNVKSYHFPRGSLYDPVRAEIEPILKGGSRSLTTTPVDDYARAVVRNSLSWWPSAVFWCGAGAWKTWFASKFLWATAGDLVIPRMFGLYGLDSKLQRAYPEKKKR